MTTTASCHTHSLGFTKMAVQDAVGTTQARISIRTHRRMMG
ncbi:MAG TPA: hypothetical protein VMW72_20185 [Sedimentisphaerales bacterium]|nr:hypothetical protein [Sedimentisphaerales bacterium]